MMVIGQTLAAWGKAHSNPAHAKLHPVRLAHLRALPALLAVRALALPGFCRAGVRVFLPAGAARRAAGAEAIIASAFCRRTLQYSHARATGPGCRLWAAASSASPALSCPTVPSARASLWNSALRQE